MADRAIKVKQMKCKNHSLACGTHGDRTFHIYDYVLEKATVASVAGAQVSDDANDRVTDSRGHYLPFNCLHVTRATESHFVSILVSRLCNVGCARAFFKRLSFARENRRALHCPLLI